MNELARSVIFVVLFGVGIFAIGFGAEYVGILKSSVFMPMKEEVRRETYEESRANVRGTIEDIKRYKYKMEQDTGRSESPRQLILQKARNIDNEDMPPELQRFISKLKQNKSNVQ